MPLPTDISEQELTAEQAVEQNDLEDSTESDTEDNQSMPATSVTPYGSLNIINLDLIKESLAKLSPQDLLSIRTVNRAFKTIIDETAFLQEKLRAHAISMTRLPAEQKEYLDKDLIKNRIRKGILTLRQALADVSGMYTHWEMECIKLGLSFMDITRLDAVKFLPVLQKYTTQLYKTSDTEETKIKAEALSDIRSNAFETCIRMEKLDVATFLQVLQKNTTQLHKTSDTEETKINAEALSERRSNALETFIKTIQTWTSAQATAFLSDLSIEQVNKLPKTISSHHVRMLKESVNFDTTLMEIQDLSGNQVLALQNPSGFSEDWIKSEKFSQELYHFVQDARSSLKDQKIRIADLEQLSPGQAILFTQGLSLAQVQQLPSLTCKTMAAGIGDALKNGTPFEQIVLRFAKMENLKPWQKFVMAQKFDSDNDSDSEDSDRDTDEDVCKQLTIEQVTQPWFTPVHFNALLFRVASYDQLQGLTGTQVEGLTAGLSYEQVNHDWFMTEHLAAIKDGVSYGRIVELNTKQVRKLRDRFSEERVLSARVARALNASGSSVCSSHSANNYEEHKRAPIVILSAEPNALSAKAKQEAADAVLAEQLAFQALRMRK